MDNYRRQQIQAKALDVLREADATTLPISPVEIARRLGIQVTPRPSSISGASGWLVKYDNDFAIIYATDLGNPGFEHFSIGHELGHYFLDGHPEHIFVNGNEHASRAGFRGSDPIEQEADYFSACLLMPKTLCLPLIGKNRDGMTAVMSLADQCSTSLVASALRYVEIGHLPAAVVQCLDGKVEFFAAYTLTAHVGWARPLPRGAKVPNDSATKRVSEDANAVSQGGEDSDSSPASDWFSGAASKYGLNEEVVGLGRFGRTLTLLTLEESEEDEDHDQVNDEDGDDYGRAPPRGGPRFR